ncbi:redoxin family protein [Lentibacter algarum]|uniref:redoxin domain-containing protein n=1 Tax=Lentibacter algarum TaxID=576131 RepID=UPI001C078927|nr:redoxin domain-containing protein [Lentibacter algarum]MBU2981037.1 redoxin family protein [Lentibacter algarum]
MMPKKPEPGTAFPSVIVPQLAGDTMDLGKPRDGYDWKLIVVYRGKHCPVCTRYLNELEEIVPQLKELRIDVAAVSADTEQRAADQISQVNPSFPVGYGLSIKQMQDLGLYISSPRHGIDVEAPFAEPGLFLVNEDGELRMVEIANVPFIRPQLTSLVGGLRFMRGMTEVFPANGTYA